MDNLYYSTQFDLPTIPVRFSSHNEPNTSSAYHYPPYDHTDAPPANLSTRYTLQHVVLSSLVVSVILLAIIVGNALVIIAIAVDPSLKGLQNWFIASLAVSDLFVGLFVMPLSLANELMGYWYFGDVVCELWLSTDVLLCTASILNLCLISLDRYWSITRAVQYIKQRTRRRAVVMISVVWVLSMVICLPPLVGWKRPQPANEAGLPLCVLSEEIGYVIYSSVGSFYLPLALMVLVYFKIYLAARDHARRNLKKNRRQDCKASSTTTTSFSSAGRSRLLLQQRSVAKQQQQQQQRGVMTVDRREPIQEPNTPGDKHVDDCGGKFDACKTSDEEFVEQDVALLSKCVEPPSEANEAKRASAVNTEGYSASYMLKYRFLFSDDSASDGYSTDCDRLTQRGRLRGNHASSTTRHYTSGDDSCLLLMSQASNQSSNCVTNAAQEDDVFRDKERNDLPISVIVNANFIQFSNNCTPLPEDGVLCDNTSLENADNRLVDNNSKQDKFFRAPRSWFHCRYGLFDRLCRMTRKSPATTHLDNAHNKQALKKPLLESVADTRSPGNHELTELNTGHSGEKIHNLADENHLVKQAVSGDAETNKKKIARARERRATVVLGIVMASFIGCWLPFFFIYPLSLLLDVQVPESVFAVIFWLGYCNSALNPIIYTIFNREFRHAFSALLFGRSRWGRQGR